MAIESPSREASEVGYLPSRDGNEKIVRRTPYTPQEDSIRPQLATLADEAPAREEWVHELKYDGYRILCRVKNGAAKLVTRNDHDWTAKLQSIAAAAAALPVKTAWLDGEVVALMPDGVISFQGLQNAFETGSETNLAYYVFDLLYLDGCDLRQVPLLDRKRSLAAVMLRLPPIRRGTGRGRRFRCRLRGRNCRSIYGRIILQWTMWWTIERAEARSVAGLCFGQAETHAEDARFAWHVIVNIEQCQFVRAPINAPISCRPPSMVLARP